MFLPDGLAMHESAGNLLGGNDVRRHDSNEQLIVKIIYSNTNLNLNRTPTTNPPARFKWYSCKLERLDGRGKDEGCEECFGVGLGVGLGLGWVFGFCLYFWGLFCLMDNHIIDNGWIINRTSTISSTKTRDTRIMTTTLSASTSLPNLFSSTCPCKSPTTPSRTIAKRTRIGRFTRRITKASASAR